MTAGAVTVATGETRLSRLGGLARAMPVLAVASGVAAATLAALPLTLGFFKDELFFAAARRAQGRLVQVLAVVAAALTFAYIGRFWLGLFTGPRADGAARRISPLLDRADRACWRPSRSSGGVVVGPFAALAADAAARHARRAGRVCARLPPGRARREPHGAGARGRSARALLLVPARVPPGGAARSPRAGDRVGPRRMLRVVAAGAQPAVGPRPRHRGARPAHEPRRRAGAHRRAGRPRLRLHADARASTTSATVRPADLPIVALLVLAVRGGVHGRPRSRAPAAGPGALGARLRARRRVRGRRRARRRARRGRRRDGPDARLRRRLLAPAAGPPRRGTAAQRRLRRRNVVAGVVAGAGAFATIWAALSRPNVGGADAEPSRSR